MWWGTLPWQPMSANTRTRNLGPGSLVSKLKCMLVKKDFLTWLHNCQPIRCQVWKSLSTNMDLTWKFLSNPGPRRLNYPYVSVTLSPPYICAVDEEVRCDVVTENLLILLLLVWKQAVLSLFTHPCAVTLNLEKEMRNATHWALNNMLMG